MKITHIYTRKVKACMTKMPKQLKNEREKI